MTQIKFKKMSIATLSGCLAMFIWGGFSHLVLFIGTGFTPLPNEHKVLDALKTNISEQGLYFFPGKNFRNSTKEKEAIWESKFRNGPTGMMIYRPAGGNPFSATKLITQFLSCLFSVSIAVIVASLIQAGYWKRVLIISLLGILACSAVSTVYWNWYGFPTSFFIAQIFDMVIGFFLAAIIICRIIPGKTKTNIQSSNV